MPRRRVCGWLAAASIAAIAASAPAAHAEDSATAVDFPTHPLRIIVPFTAGSGSDTGSRLFAEQMSKTLGQPIVVENHPGANGLIAFQVVKNAPADGYTILLASNSPMTVNPLTIKNLPYDPIKDFRPISGIGRGMVGFIVAANSPYKTLQQMIDAARDGKHGLNVGTYSAGYQLSALWFASMTGARITNVPYKGQAQIMTDLISGAVDLAVVDFGGAAPMLRDGRVRALAVSGDRRSDKFPDVPAVKESYPDYVTWVWTSFYVRAATPDSITAKLVDAMRKAHDTEPVRKYLDQASTEAMNWPPEQMSQFQRTEFERFKRVAEAAGIRPE